MGCFAGKAVESYFAATAHQASVGAAKHDPIEATAYAPLSSRRDADASGTDGECVEATYRRRPWQRIASCTTATSKSCLLHASSTATTGYTAAPRHGLPAINIIILVPSISPILDWTSCGESGPVEAATGRVGTATKRGSVEAPDRRGARLPVYPIPTSTAAAAT